MKFIKIIYKALRYFFFALKKATSLTNFITILILLKDYHILNKNYANLTIKKKIIKNLYKCKLSPSEISTVTHFRHSDLEFERFKIYSKTLEIIDKLNCLDDKTINYFNSKLSNKPRDICFYSESISFLAFNINLATIYSFFGINCTIYFFHDELALNNFKINKIDKKKIHIIRNEIKKIQDLVKKIKIINVFEENKNKLSKKLRDKIKLCTLKDFTTYNKIISIDTSANSNYKFYKNEAQNFKDFKRRYLENIDFAKKIQKFVNREKFWLMHNSSIGKSGILQEFIDIKKCNYSSHEFRVSNKNEDKQYKLPEIFFNKNDRVLNFNLKNQVNNFFNQNNLEQKIYIGSKLLEYNFNNNFNINEEKYIFLKYPRLKFFNKKKIFLLLSNVIFESRYAIKENHTIFKNFKDFLIQTMKFYENLNAILIIKCHPVEFENRKIYNESLEDIFNKYKNKNTYLIYTNKISSYSLLNIADNVIVYDTDIGGEFVFKNKNVITCGKSKYRDFDISYFPNNKSEYFKIIKSMLSDKFNNYGLFNINKTNAALFWYFFKFNIFKEFGFMYGDSTNQLINNFEYIFSKDFYQQKDYENPLIDLL